MKWKKLAAAAGIALSVIATPAVSEAQHQAGSIEAIVSKEGEKSYARLSDSYKLPGSISGYSFMELYSGEGYFGKTTLSKGIGKYVVLKGQVLQCSEPFSMAGIGAGMKIPMPKGSHASVYAVPAWIGKEGLVHDRSIIGYAVGTSLGQGFSIGSFGEINVAKKGGPQWGYGELKIAKSIGHIELSYAPALRSIGKFAPVLEHRISTAIKF